MVPTKVRKEKYVTHCSNRSGVLADAVEVGIYCAIARGAK